MAKILTKNSFTSGLAPSGLSAGELAVNVVDRKLFVGNAVGGVVTLHDQQNVVTSVNGETGGIIGVAFTNAAQTFTSLQQFTQGISATAGSTFSAATVYITNSTANIDPLFVQHSTTGALKVATTGQARIAYIKLGNAAAPTSNTLIGQSDGVLTFYNGISNTGSNMISFSTSAINIPTTISGATFSGLLRSSSGVSASAAITGGSHIFSESGFRVGSSSINSQTDSYSLQTTDDGKIITVNAGSVKDITVPTGLPIGFNCTVMRIGTGRVTFTASGTTINSVDGLLEIASQHGAASLLCYASNTFNLSGNLA